MGGLPAAAARGRGVVTGAAIGLTLLFVPQLVTMVRMHPYQYVAYNVLAGGLPGAAGRFELDYWDTSLRDRSIVQYSFTWCFS